MAVKHEIAENPSCENDAARRFTADTNPFLRLPGMALEKLHDGMSWSEGPCYVPALDTLIFSDIPNNRMLQWVPELGVRVLSHNSHYSNGITLDNQGRILTCCHRTHSVLRFESDAGETILASRYNDKPLNSPNDVVVSRDGAIWFTDPSYGILSHYEGERRDSEQEACRVYRVAPDTLEISAVSSDLTMPNGLAFSPDEKTLYVADSSRSHFTTGSRSLFSFDVSTDGQLSNCREFFEIEHGVPDGLAVDELGNVWCSSARGVEIIDPSGNWLDYVPVPEVVSNLTFGGPKNNRLFITATSGLYSIYVGVKGASF